MPLFNNARHRGTGHTLLPAATGTRSRRCSVRLRGSIRHPRCSQGRGGCSGAVCRGAGRAVGMWPPRGSVGARGGRQLWGRLGEPSSPSQRAEQGKAEALGHAVTGAGTRPQWEIQPHAHFRAAVGALLPLSGTFLFSFFFSQLCRERLEAAGSVPSLPPSSFCRSHPSWHAGPGQTGTRAALRARVYAQLLLTAPGGGTRGPNCVRCHHPAPPPICRSTSPPPTARRTLRPAARSRQHPNRCHGRAGGTLCTPGPTGRKEPNARGQPIGESAAEGSW